MSFQKLLVFACFGMTFVLGAAVGKSPLPQGIESRAATATIGLAGEPTTDGSRELVELRPQSEKPITVPEKVTVDAHKNCVCLLNPTPAAKDSPLESKAQGDGESGRPVRVDLQRGVTYTVRVSGEAFLSEQTGVNVDPFPGVVLYYGTDEEDGFATRYAILKPGESITFRSPWNIDPKDEVFLLAFFLDAFAESATWKHHGTYELAITSKK